MKNLKKVLALVLAFACAFTMFAVAGAADFTDKDKIKNYEAVNTLSALNILKGRDNGSFDPEATVTRAEMAKMIFVIWNGGKDDATAYEPMKDVPFTDVADHWAKGYINFCSSNKIIAGMGDGTFAPDQTVTGQQAAKMLLVLMGYDEQHAGLTGLKWAANTMSLASKAGLTKDLGTPLEQGMPRQDAAQMVYNTLEAYRVNWSTDSGNFEDITQWVGGTFEKETVGAKYMNYETITGVLVEARNGNDKGFSILKAGNTNKYSFNKNTSAERDEWNKNLWVETKYPVDLTEYLGQEVKVSYNSEEFAKNRESVYGVYSTDNNTVVTTTANKIGNAKENGRIKIDGTKYKLDDNMRYYYSVKMDAHATDLTGSYYRLNSDDKSYQLANVFNRSAYADALYGDYEPFIANTVKFVDYDKDGKFDLAIDFPMAVAEVSMVSSSTISVKDVRGVELTTNAPKRDDVVEYEGIAKGDIVQITWDTFHDKVKFTKLETIDETIGSVRNDINNTNEEFNISTGWVKRYSHEIQDGNTTKRGQIGINGISTKLKSGDKATFVLVNGIAYYVDRTQSGTGNDVAVVVNTADTYYGVNGSNVEAKLMFADGTTQVVNVSKIITNSDTNAWDLSDEDDQTQIQKQLNLPQTATNALGLLNYYLTKGANPSVSVSYSTSTSQYNNLLANGTIAPALVTYSRSGNDYTLQLLDDNKAHDRKESENDAGYDAVMSRAKWNRSGNDDAKVNGYNLLDDGVVFVVYGSTGGVKRYTGSQAKKLSSTTVNNLAYALTEKSNGVERVRIAAMYESRKPTISGAGNYAYLLDTTSSKTIDGTSYVILTTYTKNGEEILYAEKSAVDRTNLKKGDVVDFSYTNSVITDNGTEYKLVDDISGTPNDDAYYAAVIGWDRNDISVLATDKVKEINNDTATIASRIINNLEIDTDDTTVLVVDTDGKVGVSVGKEGIQTADTPRKLGNNDVYQVNAKVYHTGNLTGPNAAKAYDLIVIDSQNNWLDNDWFICDGQLGLLDKHDRWISMKGNSQPVQPTDPEKTVRDRLNQTAPYANMIEVEKETGDIVIPANKTLTINVANGITINRGSANLKYTYTITNDVAKVDLVGDTSYDLTKIKGTDKTSRLSISGQLATIPVFGATGTQISTYDPNGDIKVTLFGGITNTLSNLKDATFRWENNSWVRESK